MIRVRLRINIAGTVGTEAWDELRHYSEVVGGRFGQDEGTSGDCFHDADEPHAPGEWIGAVILVDTYIVAEYAVAHYQEQPRVLDAYMDGHEE